MKYFQRLENNFTYTCITCVLHAWYHMCAKNMNPWNNVLCANFKQTYETSKLVKVACDLHKCLIKIGLEWEFGEGMLGML
jgi:hypothetical protein